MLEKKWITVILNTLSVVYQVWEELLPTSHDLLSACYRDDSKFDERLHMKNSENSSGSLIIHGLGQLSLEK